MNDFGLSSLKTLLKPHRLQPGDLIGIVTPASQVQAKKLDQGVAYLKTKGYDVILGKHVFDSVGYLAGRDQDRVRDFHFMFENPEIKAIISSRGGYGTPRLLDTINYDLIAKNPKIFVGYSDVTALQLALWKHTGLITFSGPMAAVEMGSGMDPFSEKYLWSILCDDSSADYYPELPDNHLQIINPGKAKGRLLGGCLSLVSSVIGTKHQPDFTGSILILEDIGEQPYRIDRYLSQLKSAGILDQINGAILGQFIDCNDKEGEPTFTLDEIFSDYFDLLSIPVIKNFLYGHVPKKFTIPIGVDVEMDTSRLRVKLLDSAVDT
jgi:muramoyltetrapeptide carboxypeptidase